MKYSSDHIRYESLDSHIKRQRDTLNNKMTDMLLLAMEIAKIKEDIEYCEKELEKI